MPDEKPVDENTPQEVTEQIEAVTEKPIEAVEEVIEPHPDKPAWVEALEKNLDTRLGGIESRLEKAEKGQSNNAQTLHTRRTGKETSKGGAKKTTDGGESESAGDSATDKPKRKRRLWRTF